MNYDELLSVMSNDEYHYGEELKNHLSSTKAKVAYDSPTEWAAINEPVGPWKAFNLQGGFDSDAALFGNLVHDRCLIQKKDWKGVDASRRICKDGVHLLTRDKGKVNQRDVLGCCYSTRQGLRYLGKKYSNHKWLCERVATGEFQIGEYSYLVKCKFDLLLLYYNQDGNLCGVLVDLKTTNDPSEWGFLGQARRLRYAFSLQWYKRILEQNGITITECMWLAVGKSAPWKWDIYPCDQEMLSLADLEIDQSLLNIGNGRKSGWPSMKITPDMELEGVEYAK